MILIIKLAYSDLCILISNAPITGIIYLSAKSIIDVGSSTDLFGSISRREKFDKMACAFIKLAIFVLAPLHQCHMNVL